METSRPTRLEAYISPSLTVAVGGCIKHKQASRIWLGLTTSFEDLIGESGCDFKGADQPYVSIVMQLGFHSRDKDSCEYVYAAENGPHPIDERSHYSNRMKETKLPPRFT
jgi:hypothetical protein